MIKIVIIFMLSMFFFILATKIRTTIDKNKSIKYKHTKGKITRVMYGKDGTVRYCVSFNVNEEMLIAQTCYYSTDSKSLNLKDEVELNYYILDNGKVKVKICDEELTPYPVTIPEMYDFLYVLAILFLTLAILMLINKLCF